MVRISLSRSPVDKEVLVSGAHTVLVDQLGYHALEVFLVLIVDQPKGTYTHVDTDPRWI